MKDSKNPFYSAKVQKILNRLISEEMLAYQTYIAFMLAIDPVYLPVVAECFTDIAEDEMYDHHTNLVAFARQNDYDIPCTQKEYEKFASEVSVKTYAGIKKAKDAKFYLEEAIKTEEDAIKSYNEALDDDDVPYELNAILLHNLYDEEEHLEDLKSALYAVEAQQDFGFGDKTW